MTALTLQLGDVSAWWLDGALLMDGPSGSVLVDAGASSLAAFARHPAARRLRAVVLSTDRTASVSGLLGVFGVLTAWAPDRSLQVVHPLRAHRVAVLVDAWNQGWPEGPSVQLDGVGHHEPVQIPGGTVELWPLSVGEAVPGTDTVRPVAGAAVRVRLGGVTVAWLPSARPGTAGRRAVHGCDLAVVEVAAAPFPVTEHPWRRTVASALVDAAGASQVWLVGDDGEAIETGEAH